MYPFTVLRMELSVSSDECIRGAVVAKHWLIRAFQLRYHSLCQYFPEFNSPLVKGINIPNDTLRKDAMLVKSNQRSKHFRRQLFCKKSVRRPVSLKCSMRCQPCGSSICFDLLLGFSEGKCFRLRKEICHEHCMLAAEGIQ